MLKMFCKFLREDFMQQLTDIIICMYVFNTKIPMLWY